MTRKTVKLGEVIELKYGKSLTKENRKETGKYPVYGSSGVVGFHDEYLTDAPCIIVGRKGSIGSVFYSETHCFPIDTAYFVKSNSFHPRYLYYQLSALRLNELNTGAAIPGLNREDVYRKEVPLPPFHIQQQIADTLDKAHSLHQKDQELLRNYNKLAQSIFYEMFSDISDNPRGFKQIPLSELVTIPSGLVDPRESPYTEMLHVGGDNIESNSGELFNLKKTGELNLISGKFYFDSSYILYNKIRPNLNKVALPYFEGVCSADMYPLKPSPAVDKIFLYYVLRSESFLAFANSHSRRANIPKINREKLLQYKCILPKVEHQKEFANKCRMIEDQKKIVKLQIAQSKKLFQSQMQSYFDQAISL